MQSLTILIAGFQCHAIKNRLYLDLPLSFKAQWLPQIKGGLSLAGCHVVAQTQGYHVVCIWGSLFKFQGNGVVVKTMLCARVPIC